MIRRKFFASLFGVGVGAGVGATVLSPALQTSPENVNVGTSGTGIEWSKDGEVIASIRYDEVEGCLRIHGPDHPREIRVRSGPNGLTTSAGPKLILS